MQLLYDPLKSSVRPPELVFDDPQWLNCSPCWSDIVVHSSLPRVDAAFQLNVKLLFKLFPVSCLHNCLRLSPYYWHQQNSMFTQPSQWITEMPDVPAPKLRVQQEPWFMRQPAIINTPFGFTSSRLYHMVLIGQFATLSVFLIQRGELRERL